MVLAEVSAMVLNANNLLSVTPVLGNVGSLDKVLAIRNGGWGVWGDARWFRRHFLLEHWGD